VSNPAEVAKTRLQLQGELAKTMTVRVYNNVFDVFRKTFKNEGIRGVQRGLAPAVSLFDFILPRSFTTYPVRLSSKLHTVHPIRLSQILTKDPPERLSIRSVYRACSVPHMLTSVCRTV